MSRRFVEAIALAAALLSAAAPAPAADARRPVIAEDLFRLSLISGTTIAPDAATVAFVVSRMDGPADRYRTDLWLAPVASGAPRAITRDGASRAPAWSPDGATIAFERDVAGTSQIFAYRVRDGRVAQLTHARFGASGAVWSHDGRDLAFDEVDVDGRPPARIDFGAAGFTPTAAERTSDIRTIDVERYEANGEGYTYDRHAHLWVMAADGSDARALTSGPWSETAPSWSADDATVAFTSLHRHPPEANESDVYTIPATGGEPRVMRGSATANTQPTFEPHGMRLAYFSGDVLDPAEYPALVASAPDGSDRTTIVAKNATQWGDLVLADLGMPGAVCGPLLSPDGSRIVTNHSVPGATTLVAIDVATGTLHDLTSRGGDATQCSASADGRTIAYAYADFTHPAEVHVLDLASGRDRALTALNAPYLNGVTLSYPEPFSIVDAKGYAVEAWFMPAVGPRAGGRRPTLLDIHGGPQTEFGATFFHELQVWAGLGYNVVIANPQGSVGYGHAFEEALVGSWGPPMMDDLTRVMDAVATRPDVDASRLGVIGGSYGGYATLWIVGHTDRFRAAVAERPASDLATQSLAWYLASSNGLGGQYAWGKPWQAASANYPDSPLTYVEHVHTPVMLLHSTDDTETPLDQTLDEFSALKQLGRSATFVEVPGENHDLNRVGRPIHRVERLHVLADWFATYLAP